MTDHRTRDIPTNCLRWLNGKLQQLWMIDHFDGVFLAEVTREWRDVPTVTEDKLCIREE